MLDDESREDLVGRSEGLALVEGEEGDADEEEERELDDDEDAAADDRLARIAERGRGQGAAAR